MAIGSLGLEELNGDLATVSLRVQCNLTTDDMRVNPVAGKLFADAEARCNMAGTCNLSLYLNYAAV